MAIDIRVRVRSGEAADWNLVRNRATLAGDPTKRRAGDTRPLAELVALREVGPAERIGLVFKFIAGGEFIYQGRSKTIESYELDETPFTIGKLRILLAERGDEVRTIFTVPGYSVDEVIAKSLVAIAKDVPAEEHDNCPLVYTEQREEEAIARLVGASLPTERQWERAAAGTDGKLRPWGSDLDHDHAVYYVSGGINGTRPVKSKPAGVSPEGLHDLIGNVWERTLESVLRGGSWLNDFSDFLRAGFRNESLPEYRDDFVGFRLARTLL